MHFENPTVSQLINKLPCFVGSMIHYFVQKRAPIDRMVSWVYAVCNFTDDFLKIY
jgi:hypothetical protein